LIQIGSALKGSSIPATAALRLLTIGFSALIVPLAIVTRRQPGARRALDDLLAVFAVSALHLSQQEQLQLSWPVELIGHHASLPLVLSILYQEYPFALADVFLKRALRLIALMAAALLAYVTMESFGLLSATRESDNVPALVFLGVSLCTALVFPALTRASNWFVDSVVLRRANYDLLRVRLARQLADVTSESAAVDVVTQTIGPALSATSVRCPHGRTPRNLRSWMCPQGR
jgi:hypothetical protein